MEKKTLLFMFFNIVNTTTRRDKQTVFKSFILNFDSIICMKILLKRQSFISHFWVMFLNNSNNKCT